MRKLILSATMTAMLAFAAQRAGRPELQLEAAINKEVVAGDLKGAIELYRKAAQSADRTVAAKALVRMGQCYEKLGDAEARKAYERAIREYGDQAEAVATARSRLAALGQPAGAGAGQEERWIARLGDRWFNSGISRDGRWAALTTSRDVLLYDLRDGNERSLLTTTGNERVTNAAISPDGTQVAYAVRDTGPSLMLLDVKGGAARKLDPGGEGRAIPLTWTPDGRQLLVGRTRTGTTPERVLLQVTGGAPVSLGSGWTNGARFSWDGKTLALSEWDEAAKSNSISVGTFPSGTRARIANAVYPVWSPDGTRLLFLRQRGEDYDLWSVRIQNGQPVGSADMLKQGVNGLLDCGPGGELYYRTTLLLKDLYTIGIDPHTGKLTSAPVPLTTSGKTNGGAWSPNGEQIAYYQWARNPDRTEVVIRSMKSGIERVFPIPSEIDLYSRKPQWFPDNRSLFLHDWKGRLHRMDAENGEVKPLVAPETIPPYSQVGNAGYRTYVVLAPDGRSVYYLARTGGDSSAVMQLALEGASRRREIVRTELDGLRDISVSADGSRLAMLRALPRGKASMLTFPASGGTIHEAELMVPHDRRRDQVMWSPDGLRLYFTAYDAGSRRGQAYSVPVEGGEPVSLGLELHDLYYLSIHPNGRQILFADEQWNNHLWVARNLIPASDDKK